ncbi:hypothetical protein [Anditalea andensis]|uniref:Uncharacterized protein n=1 Tax=Anditalea andensis TaxID=1048983 RepID=A0A074L254_9BACT|nr:hypothetical protein [Anditalea andensis]KEO75239.1 hypothetical protein EL17_06165 [Anditalea andensis]
MTKDDLIIKLIQQDFTHLQLVLETSKRGIENEDFHYSGIIDLIFHLLRIDVNDERLVEEVSDVYLKYEKNVGAIPLCFSSEALFPVAKACYQEMVERFRSDAL